MNEIKTKLQNDDPFLNIDKNVVKNLSLQQEKIKKKKSKVYENYKYYYQVKEGQDIDSLQ